MADGTYQPKVYKKDGGNTLVVASGGDIVVEPGGMVSFEAGAGFTFPAEVVAATNVITAAESGTTFFLNHATEFDSELPLPALGLKYSFIVANAPESANYTISTSASANIILGQIYTTDVDSGTDPEFVTSGVDTITIVAAKAVVGDRVDVVSDGTNWFAYCFCSVFDAITFDTAA